MLMLLSPAKKLDFDTPLHTTLHTQPLFVQEAAGLIALLRGKSVDDIAQLMSLSTALAQLNVQRYQDWQPQFTQHNARAAILAFNGDVYEGLLAAQLSDTQLQWAQAHLLILSGLYGALRPLDLMQPYRLEMGTKLANPAGATLYAYWSQRVTAYLNERLNDQLNDRLAQQSSPCVLNLASEEYFKVVDTRALQAPVVQCVFQDWKNGAWKIISFYAKHARGLMARYVIEHAITDPRALTAFDRAGYAFAAEASSADKLVFRRKEAG